MGKNDESSCERALCPRGFQEETTTITVAKLSDHAAADAVGGGQVSCPNTKSLFCSTWDMLHTYDLTESPSELGEVGTVAQVR